MDIFELLDDHDVISDDTFFRWFYEKDEIGIEGLAVVRDAVRPFFALKVIP
jgi:hypothetical protein